MKALTTSVVLALGLFPDNIQATPSQISKKLEKMAQSLTADYKIKRPGVIKKSLAIFTFTTSKKLAEERVGFAVSEFLMQHFVKISTFVVVERAALHRILEEQKLQRTEAIDPRTAVEVGKLLGTHILLLGSVEKLGGQYQVNARMVEVESGEVVATGYEEFDAKLFEEEAKPYLALVPERQVVSLGLTYAVGGVSSSVFQAKPRRQAHTLGLAIRYHIWRPLMLDFSFAFPVFEEKSKFTDSLDGRVIRGDVNYVLRTDKKLRPFIGAGFVNYDFERRFGKVVRTTKPNVRVGVEYKIQDRMGIGLLVNYDIFSADDPVFPLSIGPTISLSF